MTNHSFFHLPELGHRAAAAALALFFLLGLLLGAWASGGASDLFLSSMRAVVSSRVSIIGLLSSLVLPLLFSAFAVYIGRPVLMIPIAFCKAFSFSYLSCGLVTAWGSAGWLVAGLVMFSSGCALPVLCWYWLRQLRCRCFELLPLCLTLGALVLIGILSNCLILPFLAVIITF